MYLPDFPDGQDISPDPNNARHATGEIVRLANHDQMLTAIPYLLGFYPQCSIVLLGFTGTGGARLEFAVRADLPESTDVGLLADRLLRPMLTNDVHATGLAIVGGGTRVPGDGPVLPHRALVHAVRNVFVNDAGIPVLHALWVSEIRDRQPWFCYDDPACRGTLTDPSGTHLAAASVAAGLSAAPTRQALVAALQPVDEQAVARRAAVLGDHPSSSRSSARHVEEIQAGLVAACEDRAMTDEQVVRLARALGDHLARDVFIWPDREGHRADAERLWTLLVRHTPAPWRAEPASLLAFSAYLRGDGALAAIALDIAQAADPSHELSTLLREVLDRAIPPEFLTDVARRSVHAAREAIAAQT